MAIAPLLVATLVAVRPELVAGVVFAVENAMDVEAAWKICLREQIKSNVNTADESAPASLHW